MKKFEYKKEIWSNVILEDMGNEGWELCHVSQFGIAVFKREITPSIGKRIEYRSEDCPFDTGIITKIDEQGVWVLWDSDHEELWISPESFSKGEAKVIE